VRRTLPLLSRPNRSTDDAGATPRRGLPRAIGVADTSVGAAAARFAVELAAGLRAQHVDVRLAWLAYDFAPSDLHPLRVHAAQLGLDVALIAIDRRAPALAWPAPASDVAGLHASAEPSAPISVLAGLPALVSFAPQLAILLESERPLGSWPEGLRSQRGSVQLALTCERPGSASALARVLAQSEFLRRR
jgi:hypothetical protein